MAPSSSHRTSVITRYLPKPATSTSTSPSRECTRPEAGQISRLDACAFRPVVPLARSVGLPEGARANRLPLATRSPGSFHRNETPATPAHPLPAPRHRAFGNPARTSENENCRRSRDVGQSPSLRSPRASGKRLSEPPDRPHVVHAHQDERLVGWPQWWNASSTDWQECTLINFLLFSFRVLPPCNRSLLVLDDR